MSLSVRDILFERNNVWCKDDDTDVNDNFGNGYPKKLFVELSTNCNLCCRHCSKKYFKHPSEEQIMPKEMVSSIIADFFKNISALRIGGSSYGEPMTSPHFDYFLENVKGRTIDIELVTNATLITRSSARLISETVSNILISVEAIGKNYEFNRGQKWDKIEKIIDLLLEQRDKIKKPRPLIITLNVTVMREFKDDYSKLVRFAKEHKIDSICLRNLLPSGGREFSSFLYHEKEHNKFYAEIERYADDLGVPILRPYAIPESGPERKNFARQQCAQPFEVFGIFPDGKILPCCVGPVDLGYYLPGEDMVRQKWGSKEFIGLREAVNSVNPPDACVNCAVYCNNPLSYTKPLNFRRKIKFYINYLKNLPK